MSKNSEKVYTEGRITYVEPNDFLADKEYSASRSDSFNITHPYEDYAISVDLIVTIPDRFTGKSNDFIIELNNDKDGKTTSFFNGEGGYLNCTPGSSTFLDIMNGDTAGHQENLGITNINITYNSYFYPEVTMNLVDVRGLSLMAPNEENYRRAEVNRYTRELAKKQGDKYQPVYDEKIANFFSALFTFPYPEFKLRVKGFYGKKVEYSLLVNDFKSSFNSQSGNFEATVKFIGKMYGLYTDIPMSYLMIAPYCRYGNENNETIWEKSHLEIEEGIPMPTFLDLRDKLLTLKKELPKELDYVSVNEYNDIKDKLDKLKTIQQDYNHIINTINNQYHTNNNDAIASNNYIFLKQNNDSIPKYDAFDNPQIGNLFKTLFQDYNQYFESNNTKLPYLKSNHYLNEQTGEVKGYYYNCTFKQENNIYIIILNNSSNNDIFPNEYIKDNKVDLSMLHYDFQQKIKKLLINNKECKGILISGVDLDKSLKNKIDELTKKQKRITDSLKKSTNTYIENTLGFKLSLKNIVKITMGHLQCFMELYLNLIKNVEYRKITDITGLSIESLDIPNHYKGTKIPPFPGIKNNENNEFCYPTDVIKTYEMEEVRFIDSLFNSMTDFNKKLGDLNITEDSDAEIEMIPTLATDLIEFNNPYKNVFMDTSSTDEISKIMFYFGARCMSYCFENCYITQKLERNGIKQNIENRTYNSLSYGNFGKLEAYNFWKANPNLNDNQLSQIDSRYFTLDYFKSYLTNNNCPFINDNKPYYQVQSQIDKLLKEEVNYMSPSGKFSIPSVITNISNYGEHTKDTKGQYSWIYSNNDNKIKFNNNYSPYEYIKLLDVNKINNIQDKINNTDISKYIDDKQQDEILKNNIYQLEKLFYYDSFNSYNSTVSFIKELDNNNFIKGKPNDVIEEYKNKNSNSHLCYIKSREFQRGANQLNKLTDIFFQETLTSDDFLFSFYHNLDKLYGQLVNRSKYQSNINSRASLYYFPLNLQRRIIEIPYITLLFLGMIFDKIIKYNNVDDCYNDLSKNNLNDNDIFFISNILIELVRNKNGEFLNSEINTISNIDETSVKTYLNYFINKTELIDLLDLQKKYIEWSNSEKPDGFQYLYKAYILNDNMITNDSENTKYKRLINLLSYNLGSDSQKNSNNNHLDLQNILNTRYKSSDENEISAFTNRYSNIYYDNDNIYYLIFNQNFPAYKHLEDLINKKVLILKPYYSNNHNLMYSWDEVFQPMFTNFIFTLRQLYSLNNKDTFNIDDDIEEYNATQDAKLSMYMTLKNLYDKHLVTLNNDKDKYIINNSDSEFSRFHFIDTFYNDLQNEICVNINQFITVLDDITNPYKASQTEGLISSNLSVYSFLSLLGERHNMMLLAMPVFNGLFTKSDNPNSSSIEDMFTPFTYLDTVKSNSLEGPSYVYFYPHQPSKHLDIPESQYKGDGFNIIPDINDTYNFNGETQISDLYSDVKSGGYIIPSFGVEYGTQKQSIFKNINVNMDNPQTTEAAVANQFAIAQGRNVNVKQPGFEGQDLYQIYSNYSYTCQVEMMGCAQIMPLMYFQLNNIPMFRGAYQIINVTHNITPGNMSTTFKGVRIANRKIPMVEGSITVTSITDLISNAQPSNEKSKSTPYNGNLKSELSKNHNNDIKKYKDDEVLYSTINTTINETNNMILFANKYDSYTGYSKKIKDNNGKESTVEIYANSPEGAFNNTNPDLRKLLCSIGKRMKELYTDYKIFINSATRTQKASASSDHYIPNNDNPRRKDFTYKKDNITLTYQEMGCALDIIGALYNGSKDKINASIPLFDLIAVEYTDSIRQLIWEHKTGVSTQQDSISNTIHIASYGSKDENNNNSNDKCEIFVAQVISNTKTKTVRADNLNNMEKAPTNLPPTFISILQRLSTNSEKFDKVKLINWDEDKKPTAKQLRNWCIELNVPVYNILNN